MELTCSFWIGKVQRSAPRRGHCESVHRVRTLDVRCESWGNKLTVGNSSSPNYLFTWTRDAALVMKGLLETLITTGDASLEVILRNYVEAQGVLQQLPNPSGTCEYYFFFYPFGRVKY